MKKFLFLTLAFAAVFCACKPDEKENDGKKELTIKATIATTKTAATGTGITWTAGDAILVTCDGESYNFTTAQSGATAEFTSTEGLTQEMVGINPLTAYYGCTQFGAFTIPQNQTISGGESQTRLPMYAYTATAPEKGVVAMDFTPAASMLEVKLAPVDVTLNKVELIPVDETAVTGNVAGACTVNPITGKVTATGNLKSIGATFPGGESAKNGLTFRFPIGWFSVTGGMKLVLTYNGTDTYEELLWTDEAFQSYIGGTDVKIHKYISVALEMVIGARDFYVAPDGRAGSKGLTAADPATLDYALSSADEGSVIHLAAGTYKPERSLLGDESGDAAHKTFEVARGLTLIGAGSDKTILDGDGVLHTMCVTALPEAKVILKDLAITGGDNTSAATGSAVTSPVNDKTYNDNYGAGLYAVGMSLDMENVKIYGNKGLRAVGAHLNGVTGTLKNIEVSGNTSNENGTGLWAETSELTLDGCRFADNQGAGVAAGLYLYAPEDATSTTTVTNCTFSGNKTSGNNSGLYVRGEKITSIVKATITDCTIEKNQANMGGGFGVTYATVLMERCLIKENVAVNASTGAGTNGANLVYPGADVTIKDCIFRGNKAGLAAAIYELTNAADAPTKLTVIGSEFSDNVATGRGGAIYARSQATSGVFLNMANCTIFNNTSGSTGSALAFYSDQTTYPTTAKIYSCTIVNNTNNRTAATAGGAIGIEKAGGTVDIYNSIVSGNIWNANVDAADLYTVSGSTLTAHKCVVGSRTVDESGANISAAPLFDGSTMLSKREADGKTTVFSLTGGNANPAVTYGYTVSGLNGLNAPFEQGVLGKDQWDNPRNDAMMGAFVR